MSALASWALYSAGVAALLGGAAWALEGAARAVGRPARWGWFAALLGSAVLPAAVYLGLPAWLQPPSALPDAALIALPPIVVGAVAEGPSFSWDRLLLLAWLGASLVLGAYLAASLMQLRVARSRWRRHWVEGVPVWLTENLGPAAVRGAILLPSWALTVDRRLRHLMLVHEEEHVRAHDPTLLLAGLGVAVLMPWNPAVWWQIRRLRLAIEIDCDARVLRREPDARLYGALLLEVGRRQGGNRLVVAFSEPSSFLERRIRALAGLRGRRSVRRAAGLGACAAGLGGLALYAGAPLQPLQAADLAGVAAAVLPERAASPVTQIVRLADRPDAAAHDAAEADDTRAAAVPAASGDPRTAASGADTARPRIRNPDALADALRGMYPPLLRDAGIGGTATVLVHVNEAGRSLRLQLHASSGYEALDDAALRAAALVDFEPATADGRPVAAWAELPIVFSPPAPAAAATQRPRVPLPARARVEAVEAAVRELPPPAAPTRADETADLAAAPRFTPMTQSPVLENRRDVAVALERNYPPLLREAGIGGSPTVWFLIDENGHTVRALLHESSGHEALDAAALEVARVMRFSPAQNRGTPVPVWVSIAIVFQSR